MGPVEEIFLPYELGSIASALEVEFGKMSVFVEQNEAQVENGVSISGAPLAEMPGASGSNKISEPWRLLDAMGESLRRDITETVIAPSAQVAETAVISGPCVVSEGVMVDDFCKLKGPLYLGPRTKIWTGSLVRESMVGPDCEIGFGCEVARTYMLGGDRIAHHDVILDSVLGHNVWMGAFIGTTNKLLTSANIRYKLNGALVDTGLKHFGAVFGHDSAVGAGTMILPGRFIPPNAIIQAGTIYSGPDDAKTPSGKDGPSVS